MGKQPKRDLDAEITGFLDAAANFLKFAETRVEQLADKGNCDYASLEDAKKKSYGLIAECSTTLTTKTPRGDANDQHTASVESASGYLDAQINAKTKQVYLQEPPIYEDERNGSFINPSELDKTVGFPCRLFKPSLNGAVLEMGGISVAATGFSLKGMGLYLAVTGFGIVQAAKSLKPSAIKTAAAGMANTINAISGNALNVAIALRTNVNSLEAIANSHTALHNQQAALRTIT